MNAAAPPFSVVNSPAPAELPPHDIMAEQALLGALMLSNAQAASVSLILDREQFFERLHSIIYGSIVDLIADGRSADVISVGAVLGSIELPSGAPPIRVYLARLVTEAVTVRDAPNWAIMIRDLAHRREIIAKAGEMIADAREARITTSGASFLEQFDDATKHILETRHTFETVGDLAWRIVSEIEAARAGEFIIDAITTGFEPLDKMTRYRPEEVIVTAGRPGQGKSIYATSSARRIAQAGVGVLEFPLENGREQALARHISDLAYSRSRPLSYSWILDRDIRTREDGERVVNAVHKLESLPLVIDDAERITVARLSARVKQEKAKFAAKGIRLGIVLIDHLDFIDASDRYAGNRVQEIGEIMKGLKAIARREKVVIHLFCQLNRGVEGREDKRPQLSDLRNSGDIEQVADVVQFLYRESYYLERSTDLAKDDPTAIDRLEACRNRLDVIIQKSRTSRVGTTHLYIDPRASFISGRI